MSNETLEELKEKLQNEEDGLLMLEMSRELMTDRDDIYKNEEMTKECKGEIRRYKLKMMSLRRATQLRTKINIGINPEYQHIIIGENVFGNFNSLFNKLRISNKVTQTQLKGGMGLLYSIVRYNSLNGEKERIQYLDLLEFYKEFRGEKGWGNRNFEKKGNKKTVFSETDCDSANRILKGCSLITRLELSKNGKEIIIKP